MISFLQINTFFAHFIKLIFRFRRVRNNKVFNWKSNWFSTDYFTAAPVTADDVNKKLLEEKFLEHEIPPKLTSF